MNRDKTNDKARVIIKKHEGLRIDIYIDSLGFSTVGYGHALHVGSRITREIANKLFELDFAVTLREYARFLRDNDLEIDEVRRTVVLDMLFNLGRPRLMRFKKFRAALKIKDYETAAEEMLDSLWAEQVGNRAIVLAEIMEKGKY